MDFSQLQIYSSYIKWISVNCSKFEQKIVYCPIQFFYNQNLIYNTLSKIFIFNEKG